MSGLSNGGQLYRAVYKGALLSRFEKLASGRLLKMNPVALYKVKDKIDFGFGG